MHQQLVVVCLIGLVASVCALDLSHASKRSAELDPRVLNIVGDLYAQVVYPVLSRFVAKLALLVAQVQAVIVQNGIHTADGRTLHPSEAELRGFWSGLWNDALKPPMENALTSVSLLAAQMLAGVGMNGVNLGIGKRDLTEAELRGFWSGLWNDALKPPMENALTSVSLLAAQMLAGVGMNGVNLGLGKRDLTEAELRGFWSGLWNDALKPPMENALTSVSLLAAQMLAGVGMNGVNLGLGKRDLTEAEMRGFADALNQALNDVYNNVIQKPLEDALSGGALMLAQVLAGLGTNGVSLSSLFGKRDLSDLAGHEAELRGIFSTVSGAVIGGLQGVWNSVLQVPLENFVQNGAFAAAGVLANLANNGVSLGKRSDEGRGEIINNLVEHASGLYGNQIKPMIENTINAAILQLAGALANFSQGGIGRR